MYISISIINSSYICAHFLNQLTTPSVSTLALWLNPLYEVLSIIYREFYDSAHVQAVNTRNSGYHAQSCSIALSIQEAEVCNYH